MKRQIFGRKIRTNDDYKLLLESECASSSGKNANPESILNFEIANTRRSVKLLREKSIEGYVIFGDDPKHYPFSPAIDFVYPKQTTAIEI